MRKLRKIVMLPTEKGKTKGKGQLYLPTNDGTDLNTYPPSICNGYNTLDPVINIPQHLYITSDEEIKDGDWTYDITLDEEGNKRNIVYKKRKSFQYQDTSTERKIMATTDPSLGVPLISELFIKAYVKLNERLMNGRL